MYRNLMVSLSIDYLPILINNLGANNCFNKNNNNIKIKKIIRMKMNMEFKKMMREITLYKHIT